MVVGRIWADSLWLSHNGSAQIVDLLEKTRSCQNIKKYPINVEAATGAVVSGKPMICGGWSGTHNFFECFQYSKTSNNWTLLTTMTMKRAYSASVSLNGKLWVTGGFGGHSRVIQASTEYVSPDGDASQPGPSLPSIRYGHCAVKLSTGQVMLVGGYSGENFKSVIIFDPDTETFDSSLPSLKYNRSYVGCAVFNSAMHDNREVVLAVGGSLEATAEVLDHTQPNAEWTESNYLFSLIYIFDWLYSSILKTEPNNECQLKFVFSTIVYNI